MNFTAESDAHENNTGIALFLLLFNQYTMRVKQIAFLVLSLMLTTPAFAQMRISGQVTDKSSGEALPGVTIQLKSKGQGTVTDIDGNYTIEIASQKNATLVFSMVGFTSKEVGVTGDNNHLNVALEEDALGLDELVVIGYGTVKKRDLTGAVSVANTDDMKKITATSVTQALQGQVPGLQVKATGAPGETGRIFIRGISSLYSDTNPLFVIDGLPTSDTRDFNPDDIESVQVLKDASAAAIYGSRAANGVIIITTKHGKAGETKIDFSAKYGSQQAAKKFDLMDGSEWLLLQEEKYTNAGRPEEFNIIDPTVNTDWGDQIFQTGHSEEYNVSASGGTATANYMISGNYMKNVGIVKGSDFERITARINGGIEKGRIKIQESALLSTALSHDMAGSPLTNYLRMPPLMPVYDANGDFAMGGENGAQTNSVNPVAERNMQHNKNRGYRVQGSVNGELRLTDWLKYQINLGLEFDYNIGSQATEEGRYSANDLRQSRYNEDRGHFLKTLIENLIVFDKQFGKHSVNAIAGYTEQRFKSSSAGGFTYDIMRDNSGHYYWSLGNGDPQQQGLRESSDPSALRSFLGRVIYNYDNRYFLTASIRRDGSSRFRESNHYGNFPSVSGAWRVSEEKFFEPIKNVVNNLKLKLSYGVLGNEAIGNFRFNSYLNSFIPYTFGRSENFVFGTMPTLIVDTSLKWEEKRTTNIGIEMAFLNNALTLEADYFINSSNDLLAQVPIPMYMGSWQTIFDDGHTVWRNAGKVENRGIEVSLGYKNYQHPFRYDMKLNLTHIKNEVKSLGGDNAPIYGNNTKTEVGRALGEFFLLKTDGIYQVEDIDPAVNPLVFGDLPNAGDQRYQDLYGRDEEGNIVAGADGNINDDDRTYVGSPWPKLEFSYTFNASYQDFDFSMYWTGTIDKTVYNSPKTWLYNIGDNGNYAAGYTGWTEENRSQTTPCVYADATLRGNTTRFIEDISFLRLKSIQIGYNLPKTLMKKAGIERCRVYLNAENLLTITNYDGLDPDFSGGGVFDLGVDTNSYPCVRTLGCGIQVTF